MDERQGNQKHFLLYKCILAPQPPDVCSVKRTALLLKMITAWTLLVLRFCSNFQLFCQSSVLVYFIWMDFCDASEAMTLSVRSTISFIESSVIYELVSYFDDSSYPRVAEFQHILSSLLISSPKSMFKQKLVGFVTIFLHLM